MRYIFFGTPLFAKTILEELVAADLLPYAVVTNPDRPSGRKQILTPPEVKKYIEEKSLTIKILQPEKLDATFQTQLKEINADCFVLAAYGKILKEEVFQIPKMGTIGVHPSLLPRYRGATPIQSAIVDGENETGTTLFLMDKEVDHGPILAQRKIPIESTDSYESLSEKLAKLSGTLLKDTLPEFMKGSINPKIQDENHATFTKKLETQDGYIEFNELVSATKGEKDPKIIYRKIMGLNPEPGVFTIKNDKRIKLLDAKIENGKLTLTKIQIEGKTPQADPKQINEILL